MQPIGYFIEPLKLLANIAFLPVNVKNQKAGLFMNHNSLLAITKTACQTAMPRRLTNLSSVMLERVDQRHGLTINGGID